MKWVLVSVAGPHQGQEFLLLSDEIRIGRIEGNDIVVPETSVSRHHCSVFVEGDRCFVQDMNSKNGTLVNDKKITKVELFQNDMLKVGEAIYQLMIEAPAIQARPETEAPKEEKKSLADFKLPPLRLKESPQGKVLLFMVCIVVPFIVLGISRSFIKSAPPPKPEEKSDPLPADDVVPLLGEETALPADISQLRTQSDAALLMRDFPTAYLLLKKLSQEQAGDKRIANQLEFVEKKLKKQIALYDEHGLREYQKLNYERAIIEWRKVLSLSKDFDPTRHADIQLRIKEAEAKMVSKKP